LFRLSYFINGKISQIQKKLDRIDLLLEDKRKEVMDLHTLHSFLRNEASELLKDNQKFCNGRTKTYIICG
jgi:hypothetical protein